ncbi:ABC-2 type transport system ATP-binding protein [Peribacillus deserti]|uniref:ABC-2 type transport system ATP-binding protein n=1 Tax=Peribacillus deserti TaxID=673318 RepID=A0ABS2QEI6_9BACI|nr:ABC transporter ATP-binding protein [Peribacillus deserti]MBM7691114.1 ABC-2 type transport system ATP-binding protein [Peribacillus deserti]
MSLIYVSKLSKRYGNELILKDVNFKADEGEIIGLLGPNGAGKTTFIRLLNGVIHSDSGTITVSGFNPAAQGDEVRKISGIVTESAGLYHQMSGKENLEFFAGIYKVGAAKDQISRLLRLFDLEEHQAKLVGAYSTGMKKRLGLAKALLHNPKILFLDEPTNGLDPEGIRIVLSYLKKYNKETGTTILICSHVLHQLETVCTSFAFMDRGTIVEQGRLKELEEKYIKELEITLETPFPIEPLHNILGFECLRKSDSYITIKLRSKEDISVLLKEILKSHPVYSVVHENNSLESIYFNIREGGNG